MADRCGAEIEAQVTREEWKNVPNGDDNVSEMIYRGLSMSERRATRDAMKEALDAEAQKKVPAVDVDPKDFAKYGITAKDGILTFKNGISYNPETHKLVDTRSGRPDGLFRIDTVYDKPENDPERQVVKKVLLGISNKDGSDNVLGTYDSKTHLLHIPARGGELIVDNRTGKIQFQPDKLVACKDLPQLTIEEVKNR